MSTQNEQKQNAAKKAFDLVKKESVIGVGTGSTANYFIECLSQIKGQLDGCVASSVETEKRLKDASIPVLDLNSVNKLPFYVDGADEINQHKQMIKGGGGALTREKIVASVADQFICIVDSSKQVELLGKFPVAVEVIPMARSAASRAILKLGGDPMYRQGYTTDNGNVIVDVHNLDLTDPIKMEVALNNIPGVVANGIFAQRPADEIVIGE